MTILTINPRGQIKASFAGAAETEGYWVSSLGAAVNNQAVVGNLTANSAYKLVPWLFRAITMRARHVSRMPYALMSGETDVTDSAQYASLLKGMRKRLFCTEASICLTGAAYWLLDANARGQNISPRWVLSQTMQPVATEINGVTGFKRRIGGQQIPIDLDHLIYIWNPNFDSETNPGPGEAETALGAASMLYALDSFAANFFNRGAVKVTVFEVPLEMPTEDKAEFQNFLNRALSGVRNAFKNIAVRGGIKPTVIGSSVKESQAPELTQLQRENVAAALEVPISIIEGRSSDDSNSRSEKLAFVTDTIIPRVEIIFEALNEQLFGKFGLELIAKPELLEVMQSAQLEQAQSLKELTGGKAIMSVNEAREIIELESVPGKDWDDELETPSEEQPEALAENVPNAEMMARALGQWRKAALEAIRNGQLATSPAPPIPAVGWPTYNKVHGELESAKTASDVREIFERNWPRSDDELRRANDLLERALNYLE